MPKTLAELRIQIDAVDRELLALLNRRAALANEVGEIKRVEGSPVFRPEREAQVINGLQTANAGPLKADNVATSGAKSCRPAAHWKRRSAWPTSGPAGTFSEQAAVQFFGSSIEHVPCVSIDEVFHAAAAGTAEFGVVPVENNTEGVVSRSLDLLLQSPLHVVGETSLLVRHNLLRRRRRWTASRSCSPTRRPWPSARAGSTPPAQGRAPRRLQQCRRRPPGRPTRPGPALPASAQPPNSACTSRARHPGRRLQPHPLCRGLPAADAGGAAGLRPGLREPDRVGAQQAPARCTTSWCR
jgi:chorismate mutase-like protein